MKAIVPRTARMKAVGPRTARVRAVEALRKVLEGGRPAGPLVGELSRGLSVPDSDLLRELVLGALRWKLALDAEIAAVSRVPLAKLAPNLREILEVALYQLRHLDRVPDYAAVSEAVEHARDSGGEGAAKLVNGVLRGILLQPAPTEPRESGGGRREAEELARFFSHPMFLVERWLERFGPNTTRRILAADNGPPRLDLLANPRRGTRDALRRSLAAEGIETESSDRVPLALTVVAGNPLRSPLHARGDFSVQDIGSQLLPLLLPEGGALVDLAAAPGGKSISAVAHGRVRKAVAVDRSVERLRRVVENTIRLGFPEIRPVGGEFGALPLAEGRHERVLLDAPCSGTGTLRKNPEIRYRVSAEAIERLARAQEAALSDALGLLAPGGLLLYSTCSLEAEENERVVDLVLERRPGFERAPVASPTGWPASSGAVLRLFPDASTDGFTAQLLRRRPLPDGGAADSVH
jgi:16S rRNA (cytosine967-C5)-methyltransferase